MDPANTRDVDAHMSRFHSFTPVGLLLCTLWGGLHPSVISSEGLTARRAVTAWTGLFHVGFSVITAADGPTYDRLSGSMIVCVQPVWCSCFRRRFLISAGLNLPASGVTGWVTPPNCWHTLGLSSGFLLTRLFKSHCWLPEYLCPGASWQGHTEQGTP